MKKKFFLSSLLILILIFPISAKASLNFPYPTPYKYINDYTGVITNEYTENIVFIGRELENKTGVQAIIAIINSTEGIPIEDYSIKLFRSWGIGKNGEDNGLLILVSIKDRAWRVEVGRGLEGIIPDALSNRVMESLAKPSFLENDYNNGILNSYNAFADYIAKDYGVNLNKKLDSNIPPQSSSNTNKGKDLSKIFLFLFILDILLNRGRVSYTLLQIIFLSNLSNRHGPRNGGGFGGGSSNGGGSSGSW